MAESCRVCGGSWRSHRCQRATRCGPSSATPRFLRSPTAIWARACARRCRRSLRVVAPAVVLVGSDLPHITPAVIAEASARVMEDPDRLVLGPASDGGYYLIAARRVPDVFSGITWGSTEVLAQTERAAVADRLDVYRLTTMADVDSPDGLREAAHSGRAPRTAAWLDAHLENLDVTSGADFTCT